MYTMKAKYRNTSQYVEELLFNIECIIEDDPADMFFWENHAAQLIFEEAYPDCPDIDEYSD